jgi:pyridoxal phosphate enzyme (YggS family)
MAINKQAYEQLIADLGSHNVTLVAVSKTKTIQEIKELYDLGQRDFGENYVQELGEKQARLPGDIRWHFIGHLQSNKVKLIAPFIYLIQSVDSVKLLREIDKQAEKNNKIINCLLQVYIAAEETKFGLDEHELSEVMNLAVGGSPGFKHANIAGLMGMASFTDDMQTVKAEFRKLKSIFDHLNSSLPNGPALKILSMGMSSDYPAAVEEGSNMVRIGSLIFGARPTKTDKER